MKKKKRSCYCATQPTIYSPLYFICFAFILLMLPFSKKKYIYIYIYYLYCTSICSTLTLTQHFVSQMLTLPIHVSHGTKSKPGNNNS